MSQHLGRSWPVSTGSDRKQRVSAQSNEYSEADVQGTVSEFSYLGDNSRESKTIDAGTPTEYLWDRAGGLPRLLDDGTTSAVHAGGVLTEVDNTTDDRSWALRDGLGSVRARGDDAGVTTDTAEWDVWGEATSAPAGLFGWTGEQSDPETGLTYLRARYYSPVYGRFLSTDPISPNAPGTQGYNPYAYARNNPATLIDPSGLIATDDLRGLGQGIANAFWLLAYILECATVGECRYERRHGDRPPVLLPAPGPSTGGSTCRASGLPGCVREWTGHLIHQAGRTFPASPAAYLRAAIYQDEPPLCTLGRMPGDPNLCPGDSAPTERVAAGGEELVDWAEIAKLIMFKFTLDEFHVRKRAAAGYADPFSWNDDGCSIPNAIQDYMWMNFDYGCARHDWAHRNLQDFVGTWGWNVKWRGKADDQLRDDLNTVCKQFYDSKYNCNVQAKAIHYVVSKLGGPYDIIV